MSVSTDWTIGHISDLHLYDSAHDVTREQGEQLADAVVADDLDLIINTGDDVGDGWAAQFLQASRIARKFAEADAWYLTIPGNHDIAIKGSTVKRWTVRNWRVYAEDLDEFYREGDGWPRTIDIGDLRIILVDTCADPTALARGVLGSEQIAEVGRLVNDAHYTGRRTILAGHHCPSKDARGFQWTLALGDRIELAKTLHQAGGVDLGLFGHWHRHLDASGVLGFRRLCAVPMCAKAGGYARFSWDPRGFYDREWVTV